MVKTSKRDYSVRRNSLLEVVLKENCSNSDAYVLKKLILYKKGNFFLLELLSTCAGYIVGKKFFRSNSPLITEKGPFEDLEEAKSCLDLIFKEKKALGYITEQIILNPEPTSSPHTPAKSPATCKSCQKPLKSRQSLEKFLNNKDLVEEYLKNKGFDICCKHITDISTEELLYSHNILYEIEQVLLYRSQKDIQALSQMFYSKIPHFLQDLKLFAIDSVEKLKEKTELIIEIQYFQCIYNPINVKKTLKALNPTEDSYKAISLSISSSNMLNTPKKLVIDKIYSITPNENSSIRGNKHLLWAKYTSHCIPSILQSSFIIPPLNSPSLPFDFNKGVYFYDNIHAIVSENPEYVLLMCEVALGRPLEKFSSDFLFSDKAYDSVIGMGKVYPVEYKELDDCIIPIKYSIGVAQIEYLFNVYSVYDLGQIGLKYLVKISLLG